ncbi:hypothetical protein DICVIV_14093, partial [Dictyocaulus viviparus]
SENAKGGLRNGHWSFDELQNTQLPLQSQGSRRWITQENTIFPPSNFISQHKLEQLVAEFLNVEDAIVFSMGFATNSMNMPCLVDK